MKKKLVSPFEGYPETVVRDDENGVPLSAEVTIVALPAIGRILVHKLRWVVGGAAALAAGVALYQMPVVPDVAWIAPFAAFPLGVLIGHFALSEALKSKRQVRFTRETFGYRTFWGRWKDFDRRQPHIFSLAEHRLAQWETRRIEHAKAKAQAKGKAKAMTPYFGDSRHLCFVFRGRVHRIMTIHGLWRGEAVQARLSDLDRVMDGALAGSAGMTLTPEDVWKNTSGSLPQNLAERPG